jgi:hypothetical protein
LKKAENKRSRGGKRSEKEGRERGKRGGGCSLLAQELRN